MKYREKDYGELIYKNGFQTINYKYEIILLSKYLKHILGFKKKDHVEFVYNLCRSEFADFNEVLHGDIVDSAITKGRKNNSKPIQLDYVKIYDSEIEFFNDERLEDNEKRLLLSLLVYKKIANEKNKIINDNKEAELSSYLNGSPKILSHIKNMACVKGKYNVNDGFGILESFGYITSTYNANFHLNFIKDIISNGNYYELSYKNFENCGLYYDFVNGNKVIECEVCGTLVKKKSNKATSIRYCKRCSEETRKEKVRINVENYRKKNNM